MLGVLFLRVVIDSVAKLVGSGADDYEGIIVGFLVVLAVTFNELRLRNARRRRQTILPRALGWCVIVTLMLLAGAVALVMSGSPAAGGATSVISALVLIGLKRLEAKRTG